MPQDSALLRSLEQATATYEANIEQARSYLTGRGISHGTARSCRLGVVGDQPLAGHDRFVGRLCIPYLTRAGVVQLKFRSMGTEEPKYLGLPNVKPHLYNVEALFTHESHIAITEGELDAVVLTHEVGIPAVGCPGVSTWQDHFPRLFAGFDRVLIFADGDQPGREFARRVADDLDNAVILSMPDGLDVTDVYVNDGAAALLERI